MTLHSARTLAGPSNTSSHRIKPPRTATSLADLYNARHAEESITSSSGSPSASSLADLYNQSYNAEVRRQRPSSTSLADLYNQQYEKEQFEVGAKPVAQRRIEHAQTQGLSTHESASRPFLSAILVDSSAENTPEPPSLLPSESDELVEDAEGGNDHRDSTAASLRSSRTSHSRSESILQDSEVMYVSQTSLPRRGALGSATRLTMDSDDEMEAPNSLGHELSSSSGSSYAVLAPPHASSSKLVVNSSEIASRELKSGFPAPLFAPHHRKAGKSVSNHLLVSTHEEESLPSMGAAKSLLDPVRAKSQDDAALDDANANSVPHDVGVPVEVVVIDDSSLEESSERATSPQEAAISLSHAGMPSNLPGFMSRVVSDTGSDMPIITEARIAQLQAAESSANATESESDGQRDRYPRRARNITDYNINRAFERIEIEGVPTTEAYHARLSKIKKEVLPVVAAPPEFFDALRSQRANKAVSGQEPPSFADFLMRKAKPTQPAAGSSSGVSSRSVESSPVLTEAQVQSILRPTLGPQPLHSITVNTEDRAALFQLKASTRRWLGINGLGQDSSHKSHANTLTLPGTGTPLRLTLGSLLTWHQHKDALTPAALRNLFDADDETSAIGPSKDAISLEAATRRLRLGRAYKPPLPATLRVFCDLENQEWVRLEEFLPEMHRLIEEAAARAQGKIIVPMEASDLVDTVYDSQGNAEVRTVTCATGGTVTVYRSAGEDSQRMVDEESQGFRIVRVVSPAKSRMSSRLGSAPVRGESEVEEAVASELGSDVGTDDGRAAADVEVQELVTTGRQSSSSATPEPVLPSTAKGKQRAVDARIKVWSGKARSKHSDVEVFIDLTQSLSTSESIGRSKRPRSPSPSTSPPANQVKHKFVSNSAAVGKAKKGVQKTGGSEKGKSLGDPFLQAEARRRQQQQAARAIRLDDELMDRVTAVELQVLSRPSAESSKRKHADDGTPFSRHVKRGPQQKVYVQRPASAPAKHSSKTSGLRRNISSSSGGKTRRLEATPSPSRGGWKGVTGWYNTRDAFSPTPGVRKSKGVRGP